MSYDTPPVAEALVCRCPYRAVPAPYCSVPYYTVLTGSPQLPLHPCRPPTPRPVLVFPPPRNLVKALPWYSSVRVKLADPQYSGFFLRFDPKNTTPYHVPSCQEYVTFRVDFHHFDRIELDLRGNTHVWGAAFSCPRLKLADMVLI